MAEARAQELKRQRLARMRTTSLDHDKTCVFSSLTSGRTPGVGPDDEEDTYIMKKRECSSEPASRSTYLAVQKGDSDIPLSGLQKPAPQPRAHKGTLASCRSLLVVCCSCLTATARDREGRASLE